METIMKVLVCNMETEKCHTLKVLTSDTVLVIKEKIERFLRIPVNQQTILFDGRLLLDNLNVTQCRIVNYSCLLLYTSYASYDISQELHRTEQSSVPSDLSQRITHGQDFPAMVRSNSSQNEQSPVPSNSTQQIFDGQDLLGIQDLSSAMVGSSSNNTKQVIQTEEYPQSSDSVKDLTISPDSRVMKLTVLLMIPETRKIQVEVNAGDNVRELRDLSEIQLENMPGDLYFCFHNNRILDENQSFKQNGVAHGDTIEILFTGDGSTTT